MQHYKFYMLSETSNSNIEKLSIEFLRSNLHMSDYNYSSCIKKSKILTLGSARVRINIVLLYKLTQHIYV